MQTVKHTSDTKCQDSNLILKLLLISNSVSVCECGVCIYVLQASTPFGSSESLASSALPDSKAESRSLQEEHMVAALGNHIHLI